MVVVQELHLSLTDQLTGLGVLLQVLGTLLGELTVQAEDELHRLLAALGLLPGDLLGLCDALGDDGAGAVLDPGQVDQFSLEVLDGRLFVELVVVTELGEGEDDY